MHDVLAPRSQAVVLQADADQRRFSLNASVAGRRLAQAIEALDPLLRLVLDWRLGLHAAIVTHLDARGAATGCLGISVCA